jgi:hypothetical protein
LGCSRNEGTTQNHEKKKREGRCTKITKVMLLCVFLSTAYNSADIHAGAKRAKPLTSG